MEALLTLMFSEKLGADVGMTSTPRQPAAEAIRKKVQEDFNRYGSTG
jgi:hypothetical protein